MSKELRGNLSAFITGFVLILILFNVGFSIYQSKHHHYQDEDIVQECLSTSIQ